MEYLSTKRICETSGSAGGGGKRVWIKTEETPRLSPPLTRTRLFSGRKRGTRKRDHTEYKDVRFLCHCVGEMTNVAVRSRAMALVVDEARITLTGVDSSRLGQWIGKKRSSREKDEGGVWSLEHLI